VTDPNRLDGIGVQHGPLRPDWGDGWADLVCDRCAATWTGLVGEECWWCWRALERMRQWQAELTLTPPEVDPDDERYVGAMEAWGMRMRIAVEAGLIDADVAGRTYRRAVKRDSSAA
jgi:hypothetical protein